MAAVLQYDIATVGLDKIHRMTRSVESELKAHASRVSRIGLPGERGGMAARRTGSDPYRTAARQRVSNELRGFEQIGRAARAADLKQGRDRISADKRANAQILRERAKLESAAARQAISEAKQVERSRKALAHGVTRSVGGATRNVLGMGAGIIGMAGGVAAADAVHSQIALDARLRQTILAARGPGAANAYEPGDLMGRVTKTAVSTGTSREDIAAGLGSFVQKTGDIKTAVENMQTFATIAKATGASVEDVAGAAADLSQKFDLKKPKDMADALSALAFQGKRGAFELKDMAGQFPRLAAAARTFGYKGASGVRELGGFAQIAMQGTGSPEAATTSIENVFMEMKKNATKIQSGAMFGGRKVSVFEGNDPTKPARRTRDIITDALVASHGNSTQLLKAFGARGSRAIAPLQAAFSEAYNKAGGGKKGEAAGRGAVEKMWKDAIDGAGDFKDMTKDAADASKSLASQMQNLKTKMEDALGTALLPAIQKFTSALDDTAIGHMKDAATVFADIAAWGVQNPMAGIGAAITASVVKDIAGAKLSSMIEAALAKSLGASGLTIGKVGTIAVAALAAFEFGKEHIDKNFKDTDALAGQLTAANAAVGAARTPEDKKKALEALKVLRGKAIEEEKGNTTQNAIRGLIKITTGKEAPLSPVEEAIIRANKTLADGGKPDRQGTTTVTHGSEGTDALKAAASALKDAATTLKASGNGTPGAPNRTNPIVKHT